MGNLYLLNYECTYSNHEEWKLQDYGLLDYMDFVKTTTEEIEEASLFEDLGHVLVLRTFVKNQSTLYIAHLMAPVLFDYSFCS